MENYSDYSWEVYEEVNHLGWIMGNMKGVDDFHDLQEFGATDAQYAVLRLKVQTAYQTWLDAPTLVYVNAYRITRHYGGPEEGGWWFDCGEPLGSLPCTSQREARAQVDEMQAKFNHLAEGDINSVLGGAEIRVYIEEEFARFYPETRPTYE